MPASAHTLQREIEDTLLKYEPRLQSIEIATAEREDGLLLSFTMTCHLHQAGLVRFGTHFTPEGQTRITPQMRVAKRTGGERHGGRVVMRKGH
jgi:type VI secretion system protein